MFRHILLTTDGSELAAKGVDKGLSIAKATGAKVTVLTVIVPMDRYALAAAIEGRILEIYNHCVDEDVETLGDALRERASRAGVEMTFMHKTHPSPATAIAEVSLDLGCDLIVMSSHGHRGSIARVLLGSQTIEVLALSTVPVLVVK